ncbi:MAG: hypothetical protein IKP88_17640 [Lachnospiraceae bacterium]|nr:hypothetical protein [Lachnospiraceae bacterium]
MDKKENLVIYTKATVDEIHKRVRKAIETIFQNGITRKRLSQILGVSLITTYKWTSEDDFNPKYYSAPSLINILKISELSGFSVDYLIAADFIDQECA